MYINYGTAIQPNIILQSHYKEGGTSVFTDMEESQDIVLRERERQEPEQCV